MEPYEWIIAVFIIIVGVVIILTSSLVMLRVGKLMTDQVIFFIIGLGMVGGASYYINKN